MELKVGDLVIFDNPRINHKYRVYINGIHTIKRIAYGFAFLGFPDLVDGWSISNLKKVKYDSKLLRILYDI